VIESPEVDAMHSWVRHPCSRCGAEIGFRLRDAGQWTSCRGCGARARLLAPGKPLPLGSVALPARAKGSCFLIWVFGIAAALVLAPATWWLVHRHERAKTVNRANQAVAAQVEAARTQMARERWDEAASLIQTALSVEDASQLDEARTLWTRVREKQAALVLQAAESALANRDAARTLKLLQTYLDNPHGTEHERAAELHKQLERAASPSAAAELLQRLPNPDLVDFAQTGKLSDPDGITDPNVQAIQRDNLQGHLAAEVQRRREDFHRRVLRIRATPVFGELQEYIQLTLRRLEQTEPGPVDLRLLGILLTELKVNNPAERQRILQTLSPPQSEDGEVEKISRLRASFKERFRAHKDFDQTDCEMFDRAVDTELNALLQVLQGGAGDQP
jgi:hypothetical protein